MNITRFYGLCALLVCLLCADTAVWAQASQARNAQNRPLQSLRNAANSARANSPRFRDVVYLIPNKGFKESTRTQEGEGKQLETSGLIQKSSGFAAATVVQAFDGSDNDDNGRVLGFRVAPPDTDGDVGTAHYVQMLNDVTTVFDKNGNELNGGAFPNNAFWSGMGGPCEDFNRGDPIVLYDEKDNRWLVSQFSFDTDGSGNPTAPFYQCVAISQTNDPLGAYNRYGFDFTSIGFNDYPKHGITTNAITIMANIFTPPFFGFGGTYIGAMDKAAMYAGNPATMVGQNIGGSEFGFVAGGLDDAAGTASFVPALFATAMSRNNLFDIWQVTPNFGAGTASVNRIAAIPISSFDTDFCSASREACIPQPSPGSSLETLSDRLMHRLQIRDFGSYQTMVASHAVDVGGGVGGIRWYEMRNSGGGWSLYQEGTYAPGDGLSRWMPSIAMNDAGDIGIGYMRSGTTSFMSIGVAGQSAANSGSGILDSSESICIAGTGAQTQTARAGDYSSTNVDPSTGNFWHTNEYGRVTGNFEWATGICEFQVVGGPVATTMHVENLTTGTVAAGGRRSRGTATITIEDDLGNPVSGATVTGDFSGTFNETGRSGVTNSSGQVTIQTSGRARGTVTVNFCVSDVTGSLTYEPNDNASPAYACGGNPGNPTDIHVANISTGSQGVGGGNKVGTATITIEDDLGNPVSGATVTGDFSGDITESGVSGTTGGNGSVTVTTTGTARGKVNVDFCVSAVVGSLPYDPNDNGSGSYACSGNVTVSLGEDARIVTLGQNYPNPFNPTTIITYALPEGTHVSLKVFNMMGQEVAVLTDAYQEAGQHHAAFDATHLSAGMYMYVMQAGATRITKRMTLLK